jgi:SAM-dependent methyltransferase
MTPEPFAWELVATLLSLALVPVMRLGRWWLAINAVFLPALIAALELDLSPWWAFAALALLVLLYGRIWKSEVPLFFSSRDAQQALAKLLPDRPISFLDVGCGDGRVLARLASARPESCFHGIEHALGPWLAARLRCSGREKQCRVFRGDLWARTLAPYDVVYAFLSPAVMQRLWEKARREMRPGTLLVSAFGVPNVSSDERFDVGDALQTQLHVWHMGFAGQRP